MRHSAVCTAAAPASSMPTARWLIREKNQLGLYLAGLYLISRCFLLLLFSPCNFNLLTKVCAEQETDRQSERAITARDGEMGICSSAGAWAALIPFNILTFIKGFVFFYKYCLSLKELQRILFLKGLHGKQILASSYFKGGQRERPKSTFKLLHTMLYIHNPIFPSSSSG